MAITLEQAKALKRGDILTIKGKKWKVTGTPRTWKTRPNEVYVPLKHGLYAYDYITEAELDIVDRIDL